MQPSSSLFDAALRGAHSLAVRVNAQYGDQPAVRVPISTGTVSMDRTRPIRRSVDLTVPGHEWITDDPVNPLSPFGGTLTVERGITYPNGDTEYIPLGLFVITTAAHDYFAGETRLTAEDLFSRIVDDEFTAPRTPRSPAQTVDIITELIQETIPDAVVNVDPRIEPQRYPAGTVLEDSRSDAIIEAAAALGCEVFADATGGFTIAPIPSLADPPVAIIEGGNDGVLVSANTETTRDAVYNSVTAYSEPADDKETGFTATIRDTDPNSPTRWDGPFGHKPTTFESSLITNAGQARVVARAKLNDSIGLAKSIDLTAVPDPRHEAGDVVVVDNGLNRETHIIDSLSIPLTVDGTLSASSRAANELADDEAATVQTAEPGAVS